MTNNYIEINPTHLNNVYTIVNKKSHNPIGYVAIYTTSNKVCMSTPSDYSTIWNTDCLEYVVKFIEKNFEDYDLSSKLDFIELPTKRNRKTKIFAVNEDHITIAEIKYHPAWRQYCLFVEGEKIIYRHMIKQIIEFITNLNDARRN